MHQVHFTNFLSIWAGDICSSRMRGLAENKGMSGPEQTVLRKQTNIPGKYSLSSG